MEDLNELEWRTAQHDAIRDCMGCLIAPGIILLNENAHILDSGTGDGTSTREKCLDNERKENLTSSDRTLALRSELVLSECQ